jgi:heme/copper-type cytochrome/quinol oxidase subunit 2
VDFGLRLLDFPIRNPKSQIQNLNGVSLVSLKQSNRALGAWAMLLTALGSLAISLKTRAADVYTGWRSWSLPPNHSVHGAAIDSLFWLIFWITMIAWVAVTIVMIVFLIKYRHRPGRRAHFTHGNTRLEMAWTIAPAVILMVLAIWSKFVWDNYRYSPSSEDPNRAIVLVVGQQFKWNVVYPGPDHKLGRYMMFPKPTDLAWPNPTGDGKPYMYAGVRGPAFLPYVESVNAINKYIDTVNPLGKDFSDPDGKDDDWQGALARELVLPKDRPIEVVLSSKDVIHDFFLPNFRVKLDAVPGMRGHIFFTATMSTKEREALSRRSYSIDELLDAVKKPENKELTIAVDATSPGAELDKATKQYLYRDKEKKTIVRNARTISPSIAQKLKDAGVQNVTAYLPGYWDLVCEELCGQGHGTMQDKLIIVDNDEYVKRFETAKTGVAMAN